MIAQVVNNANGLSSIVDKMVKIVTVIILGKNTKQVNKVRKEKNNDSVRLPSADKKLGEIYLPLMNTK